MLIDGFLKLVANTKSGGTKPVQGEGRDSRAAFAGQIAISSFEFGAESSEGDDVLNPKADGKKLSSSYAPISFKVDKVVDLSSLHLFKAYALMFNKLVNRERPPYAEAIVTLRKVGASRPIEYAKFSFKKVVLVSFSLSVKEDGTSAESLTFRFQSCAVTYTSQIGSGAEGLHLEEKGWTFALNGPDWTDTGD
jgi:type VI protein secretion system component Hcp